MWPLILTIWFFAFGAPIFAALGLGSALVIIFNFKMDVSIIGQMMIGRISSYPLLAMPLFMLAGNLLSTGGGAKSMIDFFDAVIGHIRGGLLIVTVAFCMFFAAMTGSGYATIAAVGSIMLPEMKKAGYSESLRSGVVGCSGQLGMLIPPSITLVTIGVLMERSVASLFAAGLIPGVLVGLGSMIVGTILARRGRVATKPPASWSTRRRTLLKSFACILMPPVILGGIYGGFFTPTEAAAVSCIYAMVIGVAIYGGLRAWQAWRDGIRGAVRNAVMIYAIMAAVGLFGFVASHSGMAATMAKALVGMGLGTVGLVMVLNVALLALGFFISPFTLMYMAIPILAPICEEMGINLVWLGVLWLMNGQIGAMTPPMAAGLYITARVADVEPTRVFRGTLPFLAVWTAVMFLVILIPDVSLWFPRLLGMPGV